ncbi:MAG: glycosyltransferase, partial [Hyphomicrobiales bacterium]|nr:glycosyltransferase [Hyphomicrobiales bacterium]
MRRKTKISPRLAFLRMRYPFFGQEFYLNSYPDIADLTIHPLRHYHEHGKAENRLMKAGEQQARVGLMRRRIMNALRLAFLRMRYPSFDRKFYLNRYPDIADSTRHPLRHYHEHGKYEGRLKYASEQPSSRSKKLARLMPGRRHRLVGKFSQLDRNRKTVLVVLHQTNRTGAPLIGYNLVLGLLERHNVVVFALETGPIVQACQSAGAVVMVTRRKCRNPRIAGRLLAHICRSARPEFAIVNSVEARCTLAGLKSLGIPSLCLIHEFAAYTRPRLEFLDAVEASDEVVFPASIVRENAWQAHPSTASRQFPVIPQGLCAFPPAPKSQQGLGAEGETAEYVRAKMGLDEIDDKTIVVVAVGFFSYRKGPDLFVQCASQIVKRDPKNKYHFVWVGTGYAPETDGRQSAYLADQIGRENLTGLVHFSGELQNMDAVYAASDVMLLTSRLDPLPCVCMEAFFAGLPLVCFDKTTGIVEFLENSGLREQCVAEYLDVSDMADKTIAITKSKTLRNSITKTA